ncbi:phospholipase effector Tle1 domain-containing protein [Pseudomonas triclosanedens]
MGYVKLYLEGIGTTSGEEDSTVSQGTGTGATGVVSRVRQSPAVLLEQLDAFNGTNPNSRIQAIEFDIFGFSRGAAAARHFANEVLKPDGGVLDGLFVGGQNGVVEGFDWSAHTRINFIGLFDTVAAIVDPLRGDMSPANELNPGVNLYLPAGCARKVIQFHARDEQRLFFALNSVAPQHQEIGLPGVHSDIGGGYPPQMTEKLLLTRPQCVVVTRNRPLESTAIWRQAEADAWALERQGLPGKGVMRPTYWEAAQPRKGRDGHDSEQLLVSVAIQRTVYGDLAKVALRAMHEVSLKNDVPLDELSDTDRRFQIPEDLKSIAEKILADARNGSSPLTHEDYRFLRSRYIHLSANWTPTSGLMLGKPAPKSRLKFDNKPQEGYPE